MAGGKILIYLITDLLNTGVVAKQDRKCISNAKHFSWNDIDDVKSFIVNPMRRSVLFEPPAEMFSLLLCIDFSHLLVRGQSCNCTKI